MTTLGARIKALRSERSLQQRQLAEKAGLTPPIASLFESTPHGRLHVSRKREYPVVSFDGTSERWHVLGAGLFQGKIRAVVSTLGPRAKGVNTDKVIIDPGQMKLFY